MGPYLNMSSSKTKLNLSGDYSQRLQEIISQFPELDGELLKQACEYAQGLNSETALFFNEAPMAMGLAIADELLELNCDSHCIAAAIVYPTVLTHSLRAEDLETALNLEVAKLIKGVLLIDSIHLQKNKERGPKQTDTFRKMLLAIVGDLRVVLIKLAERLIVLQSLRNASVKEQKLIAQEVMSIYAPLANRLGLGQLKWQLEDWSFRYLNRKAYEDIFKALKMRRGEREAYVAHMIDHLTNLIHSTHIKESKITGRAKHIYSIYRKLHQKQITLSKVHDAIALRILVPTLPDCYAVLGIVHATWPHLHSEFDDYIAHPKPNGYRSIHTAVMDKEHHTIEIQIRSIEMHQEAELGIAAHWIYKERVTPSGYEHKINLLRTVLDWQKELKADSVSAHEKILNDHVYVFTPQGEVIDLEQGATPLDFAYHIHTDLGHSCRGAKINGALVPLSYVLKTGDQISILSTKNGHPSRDWLRPSQGYLKTHRARQKVSAWFKKQSLEAHIEIGQAAWEKACRHKIIPKTELAKAVKHFNFKDAEHLFGAIGAGDLRIGSIFNYLKIDHPELEHQKQEASEFIKLPHAPKTTQSSIMIEGVGNLFTQIARCCKPIPGDEIIGYVTRGRGVTIHQRLCNTIVQSTQKRPERTLKVEWGTQKAQHYAIDLVIETVDRPGISRDISNLIANEKLTVLSFNAKADAHQNLNRIDLTLEVDNVATLQQLLNQLKQLPDVMVVRRK